jgi:hypothetical protein
VHALTEIDHVAVASPPGVTQERAPFANALALVQGRADARVPAPALELRGNDLGVVEDEHVAGAEQFWQVQDLAIGNTVPLDD